MISNQEISAGDVIQYSQDIYQRDQCTLIYHWQVKELSYVILTKSQSARGEMSHKSKLIKYKLLHIPPPSADQGMH